MSLGRLGLKAKIAVGFGSLLAIIAAMGAVGYRTAVRSERLAREMEIDSAKKDATNSLQQAILVLRIGTRDVLMGRDNDPTHLLEHGGQDFRRELEELKPLLVSAEDKDLCARLELANSNYIARNDQVVALYRAGKIDESLALYKEHESLVLYTALADAMSDMTAAFERQRQDALNREMATESWSKTLMLVLALGGLAIGSAIALVIARLIVRTMYRMSRMIETVSSNNLTIEDMEVESDDEMGKAARGLNRMKNGLRCVMLSIASTAENVSGSSREISAAAAQSAESAENQKQQVGQIATAMQEMAATVREVSQHTNTAARSAQSAAESAREGGKIVEDVLGRMRGIARGAETAAEKIEQLRVRSDEIGRIVGVIDEISEQTNLLALNAAIEAARAGEQGRGFAVVAGEVRRLAERTTGSTGEIAAVIHDFQSETANLVRYIRSDIAVVEQGVAVAGIAGDTLQKIIREADTVGTMVTQIACSAAQQAAATEQVTASMGQINELATESAEGSQLSAHACEELFDLALGLQNMVNRFDVGLREVGLRESTGEKRPMLAKWRDAV